MENVAALDWIRIYEVSIPLLITLVSVVSTTISNRKKTQKSIEDLQKQNKEDMDTIKADVVGLKKDFAKHMAEDEESKAKEARYRILKFYDELCIGEKHSESNFEDILDDIDLYELYAEKHPEFKNSRGKAAMDYIKEIYPKLKAKGGFLTHIED